MSDIGSSEGRKLIVGNLSWKVTWQDLKDYFKRVGDVERADIILDKQGRSSGTGLIIFASKKSAMDAISTLHNSEFFGRDITVREFVNKKKTSESQARSGGRKTRSSNNNSGDNTRLYVGNLSWDITWQDLKDHFRKVGEVVHADVMREPNGRSKGYGIVEYADADDAMAAIDELNDSELMGRPIAVREDRREGSQQPSSVGRKRRNNGSGSGNTRLYVGNLSWDITWQDLKDHFRKIGEVVHADVMHDPNGRSKGYGVVEYADADDAMAAIDELNDSELMGRPITVREDRREGSQQPSSVGRKRRNNGNGSGNTRLYVGNLSWDVAWQDLKDHFRKIGEVVHADVMHDPNGRSKGYGVVEYADADDAMAAIDELNDSELMGRPITVREDRQLKAKTANAGDSMDTDQDKVVHVLDRGLKSNR